MRNLLVQSLDEINNDLIEMGTLIEIAIDRAITALKTKDLDLAKSVKKYEKQVDVMEKKIERTSFQILVTQQPVARDLRLISSSLKLITDMQRIADQASNIAGLTKFLVNREDEIQNIDLILEMAEKTISMVNKALDAFINQDVTLAEWVIDNDDDVDDLFVAVRDELVSLINQDKKYGAQAIDLVMIAKYLERIADHSVNIANWVIYYITGEHRNPIEEE